MRIYAGIMGRPIQMSRSGQTCALGAAIAGAVVGGRGAGGHASFDRAMTAMTGVRSEVFEPVPERRATYDRLYALYRRLHDAFGVEGTQGDMYGVMKELLDIRDAARLA